MVAIVWFRDDLRITDHLALDAAIKTKKAVLPIYIYDQKCGRPLGAAAKWWLHHSLINLQTNLRKYGAELILLKGDALAILKKIEQEISISHIFWHESYNEKGQQQDQLIQNHFSNVICQSFNGVLLFNPEKIKNADNEYFKVFSPFWKHCLKQEEPSKPMQALTSVFFEHKLKSISEDIDSWQLLSTKSDWIKGLEKTWQPSEEAAQKLFNEFLKNKLKHYKMQRSCPAALAVSDLSPYIRFGQISVRQLWHGVKDISSDCNNIKKAIKGFLSELGWREFSYYTLFYQPEMIDKPLNKKFEQFPWQSNYLLFKAWSEGKTGYPLVDAGMRQLQQTGYMHNTVRLVVASFLVKDLLQPWHLGENWFWEALVDADLANNTFNWQWVTGCGNDAASYCRIYNPILQSKKYDSNGDYIRQWLPELREISDEFIHEPWLAKQKIDYPKPIIDHYHCKEITERIFEQLALYD